jgi:hypothetical protein
MTRHALHSFTSMFGKASVYNLRLTLDAPRRWLTRGTGIGIVIAPPNLNVLVVRVRPEGVTVLGQLVIADFDARLPSEWTDEYKAFLRRLGVPHIAAVVMLPSESVTFRTIDMPGVNNRQVPAALKFDLDSLHPWANEEPVHDWTRLGKTSSILVCMTRRSTVERYSTLFEQADIRLSRFTFEASALYSVIHMLGHSEPVSFLAIGENQGKRVVYGESYSRPLFLASMETSFERARSIGIAELRLHPDLVPVSISDVLPKLLGNPSAYNPRSWCLTYVSALCAAIPWFVRGINLFPREHRASFLRSVYMPTVVLATIIVLASCVLAGFSTIAEQRYRKAIQTEIEMIELRAHKSGNLDQRIEALRRRVRAIDTFRMRSKDDLDALKELTDVVAPPTWIRLILLTRRSLLLTGEAEQAPALLKVIDSSLQFSGSEFSVPPVRAGSLEVFVLRATRKVASRGSH